MRINIVVPSVFSDYPSVPEQDRKNTKFVAPITRTDVECASGFAPLESLLQAIAATYANCKVSPRLLACSPTLTDGSVGIRCR